MKISKDEFFVHLGDIISVRESDIKDGTYQLVESNGSSEILYNIVEQVIVEADLPKDVKFNLWTTPTRERLELLYDAFVKLSIDTMQKSDVDDIQQNTEIWVEKANMIKLLLDEEL